ncbi:MAG: hypothetical protein SGJ01_15285 [Gemmatimonadota bacterium]|nr:hypothetical protein [Gemmatimonadota bacterium]
MRRTLLVLALTLAIVAPGGAQQAPCAPREGQHSGMMGMQNMMEMGMTARMESLDHRLDSLRLVMGKATGSRKTRAMAQLLDALVVQHLDMHREMREKMKSPEHMPMMMRGAGDSSMADCAADSARARPASHDHNH